MADLSKPLEPKLLGLDSAQLAILLVIGILFASILVPNFIRARSQGNVWCKSSLKNIGSALEMYSTDFGGHYPDNLDQLVPNYLRVLPPCHQTSTCNYQYLTGSSTAYNTDDLSDYYFLSCPNDHSGVSVPPGYPQYDSYKGLIER